MMGGACFGVKTASQLFHAMLEPDSNGTFSLVSLRSDSFVFPLLDMTVNITVYNLKGNVMDSFTVYVNSTRCSERSIFHIPNSVESGPRFVELLLLFKDASFRLSSTRNIYFLPKIGSEDIFDWTSDQYKQLQYADLTPFTSLPQQAVVVQRESHEPFYSSITISNPGPNVAFFVRLRLVDENGNDLVPSFWSDNFVTLFSGQNMEIEVDTAVSYQSKKLIIEYF